MLPFFSTHQFPQSLPLSHTKKVDNKLLAAWFLERVVGIDLPFRKAMTIKALSVG
jgi:hypothetical protein